MAIDKTVIRHLAHIAADSIANDPRAIAGQVDYVQLIEDVIAELERLGFRIVDTES